MTNKEFQEMLQVFKQLVKLINKYEDDLQGYEEPEELPEAPFVIPPEIYHEICDTLDEDFVSLFGIS
tara:strand:+ start:44 stop:244 length:201 start_codon:yes stop_codon:yes gene_type:complete